MVEIKESTFVVPSEGSPRGKLLLSNMDHAGPPIYTCIAYHYSNNEASDFFSIEALKASLAKTLVHFYPLAGRFMIGEDGRRVVDCNNEGVLFVVARSEQSSDDIDFKPSPELRSQFVPSQTSTALMLMLQVQKIRFLLLNLAKMKSYPYSKKIDPNYEFD